MNIDSNLLAISSNSRTQYEGANPVALSFRITHVGFGGNVNPSCIVERLTASWQGLELNLRASGRLQFQVIELRLSDLGEIMQKVYQKYSVIGLAKLPIPEYECNHCKVRKKGVIEPYFYMNLPFFSLLLIICHNSSG